MDQSQIETFDARSSTLTLSLDIGLYPRDVLYAAAYVFIDRAFVLLDRDGERVLVHLRAKQSLDETALRSLAGEFENELLAQALRRRVVKANQKIIEGITSLAIAGAGGDADVASADSGDLIHEPDGDDDSMDFLDDPLGIAKPWEPKKQDA